jgi:hypothetical protein
METTYAMIGSDGKQYGPATLAQIKSWIGEGRIGAETQVWRSDTNSWLPASQYVELGLLQMPPAVIRAPAVDTRDPLLERRVRSGARWFFWIAGLSLVNIFTAGGGAFLVGGLAITVFVNGFTSQLGSAGQGAGVAISVGIALLFAMFGFFAWKLHGWAFIAGMILYSLDALMLVVPAVLAGHLPDLWLMAAFHLLILAWIFRGWRANSQLKAASPGGPA